ncbi:MAG: hypothetical protein LC750_11160 [Actinobacteria bacterium]|nr:hypothetical protein [Actinomycetota bacterium]
MTSTVVAARGSIPTHAGSPVGTAEASCTVSLTDFAVVIISASTLTHDVPSVHRFGIVTSPIEDMPPDTPEKTMPLMLEIDPHRK